MSWVVWAGLLVGFGLFLLGLREPGVAVLLATPPATVLVGSVYFLLRRAWSLALFGLATLLLALAATLV